MALTEALGRVLDTQLPLLLPTLAVLVGIFVLQTLLKRNRLASIPVACEELGNDEKRRQEFLQKAYQVYLDGYKKYKNQIFRIVTSKKDPVIVMPAKHLNELRNLPDDTVSFDGAVAETMHAKYTQLETGHKIVPHVIKSSLTPGLVRLNPSIADEVQECLGKELPPCDDWTSVNINQKLLRIVAVVSGRVFLGAEVARTEEYIDAAINYTLELMNARNAVDSMRPWLRPFLASRLPEIKKLNDRIDRADRLLQPLMAERRKLTDSDEKPDDFLQWILDGQAKYRQYTSAELARVQLGLSFAAIHTTTMTSTNTFYNLAAYPQYIPILRDEIKSVLAQHNGVFTSLALQNMKRLDSFIKESMRLDPPGSASFTRKVTKTFSLSTGEVIPEGVQIEVPAEAICKDPEIFPEPEEFRPWRFYELRESMKGDYEAAQHQFVSIGPTVLTFGWGRHACPGRFFAANELKMIIANALLKFDIKMPGGEEGKRWRNFRFGGQCFPDPTKEIMFKRI
ncbi:putative cytochrome P450 E-class, group IV [Podospora fimiseda]|uniref:Cytochrome P450 E-class, group IV n=1 Tax=Podospora fimiseda TaxID=252190 RepID=A0AAN7BK22_9PEZI|nr:putative cytochrome P450 E-class, group IV [Podospora fimiseda]